MKAQTLVRTVIVCVFSMRCLALPASLCSLRARRSSSFAVPLRLSYIDYCASATTQRPTARCLALTA